eukprot:8664361-Lingulodinium_polyedra.AAC.1
MAALREEALQRTIGGLALRGAPGPPRRRPPRAGGPKPRPTARGRRRPPAWCRRSRANNRST